MSGTRPRLALASALVCIAACARPGPGVRADEPATTPAGFAAPAVPTFEVAVTVDDLPRHGPLAPGTTRLGIDQALLEAFARHRVPSVYGFVNAARAETADEQASLRAWVDAGQPLGNHTAHHPDIGRVGLAAYLADVDAGEPLLRELLGPGRERTWKVFRYPFLWQGTDVASRLALRKALVERGYRIAEVTIDFDDWAYNPPCVRCVERGDTASVEALDDMFLESGVQQLQWADAALRGLVGRPVPHVLLLHAGAYDARIMDRLLTAYEQAGARWVTLDRALADPVYATEPDPPRSWRAELPAQMFRSRQRKGWHSPAMPDPLLERLCR